MNLRFVESFVLTAALGSFSKAADALCVTQAAVAARVAKLEEELGVLLFEREGSTLRLSADGRRALPAAQKLVDQGRDFTQQLRDPALIGSSFRVGWTGYVSHLALQPLGEALMRRYPRMSIELQSLSSLDVMDQFVQGRIDLGICVGGPQASRGWIDVSLFSLPLRWVCSPVLFPEGPRASMADIASRPVITYPVGTLPYKAVVQQFLDLGLQRPPLYSMNTLEELSHMVSIGAGSAVMPLVTVRPLLLEGRLIVMDVAPPVAEMAFHAVYRENAQSAMCKDICDLVRSSVEASLARMQET